LIDNLLSWPKEDVFPIIDLVRLLPTFDGSIIERVLKIGFEKEPTIVLKMLTFRFLCNVFGKFKGIEEPMEKILAQITEGNTNFRLAYSTLLINYSALFCKQDVDKTVLFDKIISLLKEEKEKEVCEKLLIALGTLTHNNLEGKKKVLDCSGVLYKIKDCKKIIDQLLAYSKEI